MSKCVICNCLLRNCVCRRECLGCGQKTPCRCCQRCQKPVCICTDRCPECRLSEDGCLCERPLRGEQEQPQITPQVQAEQAAMTTVVQFVTEVTIVVSFHGKGCLWIPIQRLPWLQAAVFGKVLGDKVLNFFFLRAAAAPEG